MEIAATNVVVLHSNSFTVVNCRGILEKNKVFEGLEICNAENVAVLIDISKEHVEVANNFNDKKSIFEEHRYQIKLLS